MKNHNLRLNGFTPFPEVNGTVFPKENAVSPHKYGHGRERRRARGRGKFHDGDHYNYTSNVPYRKTSCHQKQINIEKKQAKAHHHFENDCHRR